MIRWNVYMDVELLDRAKKFAADRDISASDVVRQALLEYLERSECSMPMVVARDNPQAK